MYTVIMKNESVYYYRLEYLGVGLWVSLWTCFCLSLAVCLSVCVDFFIFSQPVWECMFFYSCCDRVCWFVFGWSCVSVYVCLIACLRILCVGECLCLWESKSVIVNRWVYDLTQKLTSFWYTWFDEKWSVRWSAEFIVLMEEKAHFPPNLLWCFELG